MFAGLKLPRLRRRSKSLSQVLSSKDERPVVQAPQTPVLPTRSSSNKKNHRRRTSDVAATCPSISSLRSEYTQPRTSEEQSHTDNLPSPSSTQYDKDHSHFNFPRRQSTTSACLGTKVTDVRVDRDSDGSLGVTLRGAGRLHVTNIRPNGPAHRCGRIKPGDRLLRVDQQPLAGLQLAEAQQLLQRGSGTTTLTIEYDVNVMESVKYASGPLVVEVERHHGELLGLVLTDEPCESHPGEERNAQSNGIYIERIIPASVADRCGALHVGDQILAVDDVSAESGRLTPQEVIRLLNEFSPSSGCSKLQILPFHVIAQQQQRSWSPETPSMSGCSITSTTGGLPYSSQYFAQQTQDKACTGWQQGVYRTETLSVWLQAQEHLGYGLCVASDHMDQVIITDIVPDSPASRCGRLQVGDRIIAINRQWGLTLAAITSLLDHGYSSTSRLLLHTEFDVADTVVPHTGIFNVTLPNSGTDPPGLGITITASRLVANDPFVITDIRRGSAAHRTGSLRPGDRLLEVDGRTLDHTCVEQCVQILRRSNLVRLKVERTSPITQQEQSVEYTLEVERGRCGALGITISGSETGRGGVTLAALAPGGLAERTGALHPGDRILSINGKCVRTAPLSEAIRLLQNSGDIVQLRISRSQAKEDISWSQSACYEENIGQEPSNVGSTPGSTESQVDSWDSGIVDSITVDTTTGEKVAEVRPRRRRRKHTLYYSDTEGLTPCPSSPMGTASPLPLPDPGYSLSELHHVLVRRDPVARDFGFTVCDGLCQRGVYVDNVRRGSPAHLAPILAHDRILQINGVGTSECGKKEAAPLLAASGDCVQLLVARSPLISYDDDNDESQDMNTLSWNTEQYDDPYSSQYFATSQFTITKTL